MLIIMPTKLNPPTQFDHLQRLDATILAMIRAHKDRPCPTLREIQEWTGLPRRGVWKRLADMEARGLIVVELQETRPCGRDPKRRRISIEGENTATTWTENRRPAHAR